MHIYKVALAKHIIHNRTRLLTEVLHYSIMQWCDQNMQYLGRGFNYEELPGIYTRMVRF